MHNFQVVLEKLSTFKDKGRLKNNCLDNNNKKRDLLHNVSEFLMNLQTIHISNMCKSFTIKFPVQVTGKFKTHGVLFAVCV